MNTIPRPFHKINGTFAGGSRELCTHILREEGGFPGRSGHRLGDRNPKEDQKGRNLG